CFKEFPVRCPIPAAEMNRRLLAGGIRGGVDLGRFDPARADQLLVAVTEKRTRSEMDLLVSLLEGIR
ncbi:MAG: glycine dehydrogenase, partial [Planctomycetota bacterium]